MKHRPHDFINHYWIEVWDFDERFATVRWSGRRWESIMLGQPFGNQFRYKAELCS